MFARQVLQWSHVSWQLPAEQSVQLQGLQCADMTGSNAHLPGWTKSRWLPRKKVRASAMCECSAAAARANCERCSSGGSAELPGAHRAGGA